MQYKIGTRVRLLHMSDPAAPPVGTEGIISYIDALGDLGVDWDNGSRLKVIFDAGDEIERACPICGRGYSVPPAISRKDNETEICPDCGVREALEAAGLSQLSDQILSTINQKTL